MHRTFDIFTDNSNSVATMRTKLPSVSSANVFKDPENLKARSKSVTSYNQHKKPLENVGNIMHHLQNAPLKQQLKPLQPLLSNLNSGTPSLSKKVTKTPAAMPIKGKGTPLTGMSTTSKATVTPVGVGQDENQLPEPEYWPAESTEDDYEDIWPKSERIDSDRLYKIWDFCRPLKLSECSPPPFPVISPASPVPDIEFPKKVISLDFDDVSVPEVPLPDWNDEILFFKE